VTLQPPRRSPTGGFTIVEVLVSIVCLGFITSAIVSWQSTDRTHVATVELESRWTAQARVALSRIGADARTGLEAPRLTDGGLSFSSGVIYELRDVEGATALVRAEGDRVAVLATHVADFAVDRSGRRLDVTLEFLAWPGNRRAAATHRATVALPSASPGRRTP